LALVFSSTNAMAEAVPDMAAAVSVARPAYAANSGPVIGVDAGHQNYHTIEGRYGPFAALLRNDGYKVVSVGGSLTSSELKPLSVLVIANALAKENVNNWRLPTPSAFRPDEIEILRTWVAQGGSFLLIADHMPFAGAAKALAAAFGFDFENDIAAKGDGKAPEMFSLKDGSLVQSAITRGAGGGEPITEVQTFVGSSFTAPPGALPIMRLDGDWTLLDTTEAGKFPPDLPHRQATENDLRAAALEFGKGRVVVVSEAAMFSAQFINGAPYGFAQPSARQDKQLVLNIMEWLSRAAGRVSPAAAAPGRSRSPGSRRPGPAPPR
jgi:hypothetical protein